MSAQIIPFDFNKTRVRVIERDGEPWFVAKDVAVVLGYTNPRKAVSDHCKCAISGGVTIRDSIGRDQNVTIIPERDVYRLVMRSRLPSAERFEEWVVGEVLPAIRKTGRYAQPDAPVAALPDFTNPAEAARAWAEQFETAAQAEKRAVTAESVAREYEADHQTLKRIAVADGSVTITDAAKMMQMRPKDLFAWMRENGWIYRRSGAAAWVGYQSRVQTGSLEHKVTTVARSDGTERIAQQVRITPKGFKKIGDQLYAEGRITEKPAPLDGNAQELTVAPALPMFQSTRRH